MRILKTLLAGVVLIGLATSIPANADLEDAPESANWYFHIDLKKMKSEGSGKRLYAWLEDEVFDEVMDDTGIDLTRELDSLTSYSVDGDGVLVFDGKMSQATRDLVMTFVASGGDINPLKFSGKTYFHFGGDDSIDDDKHYRGGNIKFQLDSWGDESWISMDLKNRLLITATEEQIKTLLASNGRIPGAGKSGALVVLTAEKALVQAGLNAGALAGDNGKGWSSNILRNTKHVAFLISAASDTLLVEASLVAIESDMVESLASVVRGLISLAAFNDDMDANMASMLQATKVKTKGNSLSISLAVDPELVVATLDD